MKKAKVYIAAYFANCPYCGESLEDDNGSQMFSQPELLTDDDLSCECSSCGKKTELPKRCLNAS